MHYMKQALYRVFKLDLHQKNCLLGHQNKNKPKQPQLFSLFQDSEGTSTSTETNNTSYESPDTQLFGALRMRAWHTLWATTPTSHKNDCYFSF